MALHYKFKSGDSSQPTTLANTNRYVNDEQLYKIDRVVEDEEKKRYEYNDVAYDDEENFDEAFKAGFKQRTKNVENVERFEKFLDDSESESATSTLTGRRPENFSFKGFELNDNNSSLKSSGQKNSLKTKKERSLKPKLKKLFKLK